MVFQQLSALHVTTLAQQLQLCWYWRAADCYWELHKKAQRLYRHLAPISYIHICTSNMKVQRVWDGFLLKKSREVEPTGLFGFW